MARKRGLFDFAVERPVLTAALNLILVTLGLAAIFALPIREFPSIDPPTVSIQTQYIGAASEVVEREVTQIIEDNLSGIDGIRLIQSQSRNQSSSITIEFVAGTNLDAAAADVRDRVSAVRTDLPAGVEEPVIEKASADEDPTLFVTLTSDEFKPPELTDIANRLIVDRIGNVSGVARIRIDGDKTYAMRVWLDRAAMAARGVTPSDVTQRIEAENIVLPAGSLETSTQDITIRSETRFTSADEFRALILRDDGRGDRVTLGDVARVEVGVEEYRGGLRSNGREAVSLGVIRQSTSNALEVADDVRAQIDTIRSSIPREVNVSIDIDDSIFIRESLKNVATTLLIVIGIVVLVTWLSLGSWRATLIPAALIPASVIPAFAIAWALGYSVNVLTILAVIVAIDLTTDDAVVIVENVRRRQQGGEPMPIGALRGTRQVAFAAVASSAVLVAVIFPLGLIPGNVGRLFLEFAVMLTAIVIFSTTAALTLAPMLASKLLTKEEKPGRISRFMERGLKATGKRYEKALAATLGRPLLPIAAAAVLTVLGFASFFTLSSEVAPSEDRGSVRIFIEAPEGASASYTNGKVQEVERLVAERYLARPGTKEAQEDESKPVRSMLAIVVPAFGGSAQTNIGILILTLADWGDRSISQQQFEDQLQAELRTVNGISATATSPPSLGVQRRGPQLQFVLSGLDRDEVVGWARKLLERASDVVGLQSPDLDYRDTRPELQVTVDRARAAALGVETAAIGEALQVMFGSIEVTRYLERGEEYEVIVQARPEDRMTPADLRNVYVRAAAPPAQPAAGGGGSGPTTTAVTASRRTASARTASAGTAGSSMTGAGGFGAPAGGAGGGAGAGASDAASATGALVPLSSLVTVVERGGVRELNRLDRQPSVSLESALTADGSLGDAIGALQRIAETALPAEAQIGYLGEARELEETGSSVYLLFALVLILIYLVLAGQFESFLSPAIVLLSAPVALAGGVLTMWLFGLTINIYTQIALILLIGLSAKNAILLVEFANQLREEGKEPRDAILMAAGIRLRPILMTSAATILAAVPLILESGAGSEARQTLGAVTAGGLTVGTLLTLFLVPTIYASVARYSDPPGTVAARVAEQDEQVADGDTATGGGDEGSKDGPDAPDAPDAPRPATT